MVCCIINISTPRKKHDAQYSCSLGFFCCCFFTQDHITREVFEDKLKQFTGEIMQVPPL